MGLRFEIGLLAWAQALILICSPAAVADGNAAAFKDKWALVVGISKFKDPAMNLKYGSKDARDFYNYLLKEGRFAPDHVALLLDEQATRVNIISTLGERWLPHVARPGDLVVVYISTHGSPAEKSLDDVNYLITHDTSPDNPHSSGIAMQDFAQLLKERVHSDKVVVFLDACHSGNIAKDTKALSRESNASADKLAQESGKLVICSSKPNQTSWESKDYANGVFTHGLIEALKSKGEATTLIEAFNKMKESVEEEVLRDRGALQTPVLSGNLENASIAISLPASQPVAVSPDLRPPGAPEVPKKIVIAQPKPVVSFAENLWQTCLSNALKAKEQGRYTEAAKLLDEAVKEIEKCDDADLRVGTTLAAVADLKTAQGKYAAAEPLYRKALAIKERTAGANSTAVAQILNGLANLLLCRGKYIEAEAVLRRAVSILEKSSPDSEDCGKTFIVLARVLIQEGKYSQAQEAINKLKSVADRHPNSSLSSDYLIVAGRLALVNGRTSDAKKLLQKAINLKEQSAGANHPDLIEPLNAMASLYAYQARYSDAEPLLYRSLAVSEEGLGRDHPVVADSLEELAVIGELKHRYPQAESNFKRALEIRENGLGNEHPSVARTLTNMAWLKYAQEDYPQSDSLFRKSQTILEKSIAPGDPRTLATLEYYTYLLKSTNRKKQASELAGKIKKLKETQRLENPAAKGNIDSKILSARVSALAKQHDSKD